MSNVVDEILQHYGTKGMKWGVRREEDVTPSSGASIAAPKGLEKFSKTQARSMNSVASNMQKAYGYKIDEFFPLTDAENGEYLAIVNPKQKGELVNSIRVTNHPMYRKVLINSQNQGWLAKSVPGKEIESNLTHESAHGLFHANDVSGRGVPKKKDTLMAPIRKSAWAEAEKQAIKDGDIVVPPGVKLQPYQSNWALTSRISKYASTSPFIEEHEAEMFAAYHWAPNPPKFVDVFMNDIHKNMGKNVRPFSGRRPYVS